MKLSDIKSATQNIEQGGWVGDLPNLPGVSVRVRGYGNSDYRKALAKLRGGLSKDVLETPEAQEKIETKLLAEAVLIDWAGIDDMPYSRENAEQLLGDPEMAVFRMAVTYAASVVAKEGRASLEADAKN